VLDKLTPNQRLMLAVAMSVVFFVAYTAIFPPAEPENLEANKNTEQSIALKQNSSTQVKASSGASSTVEQTTGHSISEVEKYGTSDTNTILTVTNKDFILKIDTLGRISLKELL
jgi:YidC/Oxa1 family membrane protein insertase